MCILINGTMLTLHFICRLFELRTNYKKIHRKRPKLIPIHRTIYNSSSVLKRRVIVLGMFTQVCYFCTQEPIATLVHRFSETNPNRAREAFIIMKIMGISLDIRAYFSEPVCVFLYLLVIRAGGGGGCCVDSDDRSYAWHETADFKRV